MAKAGSKLAGAGRSLSRLGFEQRVAGIAALLLLVSTFGPFSFVEAAVVLVALAVLALLRARADPPSRGAGGKDFQLPFGDGAVIAVGGAWAGALILVRLFDRPLGQNLLALACAAILVLAGLREQSREGPGEPSGRAPGGPPRPSPGESAGDLLAPLPPDAEITERLPHREAPEEAPDTAETEPLAPPEFEPGGRD